jgi:hypothetical protein
MTGQPGLCRIVPETGALALTGERVYLSKYDTYVPAWCADLKSRAAAHSPVAIG